MQAYKYIQRPAAPMQVAGHEGAAMPGTRVISGQPIGMGGRARPSTFPPFPQVCSCHLHEEYLFCQCATFESMLLGLWSRKGYPLYVHAEK